MSERALERSSVIYVPPARRSVRKARMPFFMKKWRRERPACRRSPSRNVGRENTVLRVKVQVCRLPAASCAGKRPRMDKRRVAPFREKFSSGPPASCTGGTPPLFRNAVSFPSCRLQGENLPPSSSGINGWSSARRHFSEEPPPSNPPPELPRHKKTSLSANSGRQAGPTEEKKRRVWCDSGLIRNPWLLTTPYLQEQRQKSRFKFFLF